MSMDSFISQLVLVALSLSMNIHPRTEREEMRANCPIMTGITDRISGTTCLISPSINSCSTLWFLSLGSRQILWGSGTA